VDHGVRVRVAGPPSGLGDGFASRPIDGSIGEGVATRPFNGCVVLPPIRMPWEQERGEAREDTPTAIPLSFPGSA
jgi:hypothetical protein